ncbi:helix-turn-helix transcriptional regulator [Aquimarina latercula]|uniref:helix-turn-helix transcriptional regulator n=1 Tax=Aquimarina latercula TaxID=987 RepID=UPI0004272A26|nr:helix-turn-helix domain-containing protein [Aquimarina latercula]
MKKKIKEIMDYYGLNQKEFAEKIKVVPQTISDILKDKRNAGDKVTQGILEAFDEINPLWLLRDVGEMLLDGEKMAELNRKKIDKELHFESLEELALFCSNNEDELMRYKTFSNIIDKHAAYQVLKMVKGMGGRD